MPPAAVKETRLSSRVDVTTPPVLLWCGDTRRHAGCSPCLVNYEARGGGNPWRLCRPIRLVQGLPRRQRVYKGSPSSRTSPGSLTEHRHSPSDYSRESFLHTHSPKHHAMLLEREDSFMSEFEDACSAWVDSVGSSRSDGSESDLGSPFCQGESTIRTGFIGCR